jgi:hypothetical protein
MSQPQIEIGISAIDLSGGVLNQVDSRVSASARSVILSNEKMARSTLRVSEVTRQRLQSIAIGAAGLASGIAGFATSFDTLERAQIGADRATLVYEKSLERLKEMQDEGKVSAVEFANQQEQVRLNLEKSRLAQDQLGDTYSNFLANIPAQLVSFGTSAIGLYDLIKNRSHETSNVAKSASVQYSGALQSMNNGTKTTSSALHAFKVASISAFISNPIGIAILGVSTLVTMLATNTFGLRDAFVELGHTLYEFLHTHLGPLADGLAWLYDSAIKPLTSAMNDSILTAYATGESFEYVAAEAGKASKKIFTFNDYLTKLAQSELDAKDKNLMYLESIGKLGLAVGLTNERLDLMVGFMQDATRAKAQALETDFKLVASAYNLKYTLALTNTELRILADNLRKQDDYYKQVAKSAHEAIDAKRELEKNEPQESRVRFSGELLDAREKYAGLDLIKIGGNWRPKQQTLLQRQFESESNQLSSMRRRFGKDGLTESELQRLNEQRAIVDNARYAYEKEKRDVDVMVTLNKDGTTDVEVRQDGQVHREHRNKKGL